VRVPPISDTATRPTDDAAVLAVRTALPVVLAVVSILKAAAAAAAEVSPGAALSVALADGTATTESSPAPSAAAATSAMRLRSVFVDFCLL